MVSLGIMNRVAIATGNNCHILDVTSNVSSIQLRTTCGTPDGEDISFIQFGNCNFTDHLPYLFNAFPNLISIDASNTKLRIIENTTFDQAIDLVTLQLFNNSIAQLDEYIFKKMSNLKDLDLAWNTITNISEHTFEGLHTLSKLDLSWNFIDTLPEGIFYPLRSVRSIRLSNNYIEVIDVDTFSQNRVMHTVYLDYNRILRIEPKAFQTITSLRTIQASNNPLHDASFLRYVNGVKVIYLTNTSITSLYIPSTATEVQADNNKITNITAIKGPSQLSLNLANNSITTLGGIKNLSNLEILLLSFNHLSEFNFNDIRNLTVLHQLGLEGNNFKTINATGVKSILPKLEIINLSLSKWNKTESDKIVNEFTSQQIYIMNMSKLVNPEAGTVYSNKIDSIIPIKQNQTYINDDAGSIFQHEDSDSRRDLIRISDELKAAEQRLLEKNKEISYNTDRYTHFRNTIVFSLLFACCIIVPLSIYFVYLHRMKFRNCFGSNHHVILEEFDEPNTRQQQNDHINDNAIIAHRDRSNLFGQGSPGMIMIVHEESMV